MSATDAHGHIEQEPDYLGAGHSIRSWLLTTDHKRIGILYLGTLIVFSLGAGMLFERVVPSSVTEVASHRHAAGPIAILSAVVMIAMFLWFAAQEFRSFLRDRAPHPSVEQGSSLAVAIDGMTCGGCANKVRTRLMALPGAEDVEVELDPGRATIRGPVQVDDAIAAVRAAGYQAALVGSG